MSKVRKILPTIWLVFTLFSINCLAQNRTGNYSATQLAFIKNAFYESEQFDDITYDIPIQIFNQIRTSSYINDHIISIIVFGNQTHDVDFFLSKTFLQDNKLLVWNNFGVRKRSYLLWVTPNRGCGYNFVHETSDEKQFFNYQIDNFTLYRIKGVISEAIIRKGSDIYQNANYIASLLQQINLGTWLVVISVGPPKMAGIVMCNIGPAREYGYINNFQYFGWNYFLAKMWQ